MKRTSHGSLLPFIALVITAVFLMKCTEYLKIMILPMVMVIACMFAVVTNWLQVRSSFQFQAQRIYTAKPFLSLRHKQ